MPLDALFHFAFTNNLLGNNRRGVSSIGMYVNYEQFHRQVFSGSQIFERRVLIRTSGNEEYYIYKMAVE
jgi:hypothetical protein